MRRSWTRSGVPRKKLTNSRAGSRARRFCDIRPAQTRTAIAKPKMPIETTLSRMVRPAASTSSPKSFQDKLSRRSEVGVGQLVRGVEGDAEPFLLHGREPPVALHLQDGV